MAGKGRKQYENPVKGAIAKSAGMALAGTRASASKRIVNDSQLLRTSRSPQLTLKSTDKFLDQMGVAKNKRKDVRFTSTRGKNDRYVVQRHRSDKKDPNTGFGMNVTQIRGIRVSTSGS